MTQFTVKDLLQEVLRRLDRLDQQMGAANIQLGSYQDLAHRLSVAEAGLVEQSRQLAIHTARRGHEDGLQQQEDLIRAVAALKEARDQGQGAAVRTQALWLGSFTVLNAVIALASFAQHVLAGK